MPGVDCDLIEFRHHPVNAERLIPQLSRFDHGGGRFGSGTFRVIQHQIRGRHVSMFSIRCSHFVPVAVGLSDDLHERTILIGRQYLVLGAGTRSQAQCAFSGFCTSKIRIDSPDFFSCVVSRRGEVHSRSHSSWYRSAKDANFNQTCPFSGIINWMYQCEFILTVQDFGDLCGQRSQSTIAIGRKVNTVGWIYADQIRSPP